MFFYTDPLQIPCVVTFTFYTCLVYAFCLCFPFSLLLAVCLSFLSSLKLFLCPCARSNHFYDLLGWVQQMLMTTPIQIRDQAPRFTFTSNWFETTFLPTFQVTFPGKISRQFSRQNVKDYVSDNFSTTIFLTPFPRHLAAVGLRAYRTHSSLIRGGGVVL